MPDEKRAMYYNMACYSYPVVPVPNFLIHYLILSVKKHCENPLVLIMHPSPVATVRY